MTDSSLILQEKRALRARIKAWRGGLTPAQMTAAADAIAGHGLSFLPALPPKIIVSGFAPLTDELRTWPLLRRLAGEGIQLAMPVVQGKGLPLVFRAWAPGDAMDSGVWGIAEPKADRPVVDPDILLMPLLAFDRRGGRLGYGGGFYDRSLQGLRARKAVIAVGLAYDEQEVDAVPRLDYDERLDWVLTPSGPHQCKD